MNRDRGVSCFETPRLRHTVPIGAVVVVAAVLLHLLHFIGSGGLMAVMARGRPGRMYFLNSLSLELTGDVLNAQPRFCSIDVAFSSFFRLGGVRENGNRGRFAARLSNLADCSKTLCPPLQGTLPLSR